MQASTTQRDDAPEEPRQRFLHDTQGMVSPPPQMVKQIDLVNNLRNKLYLDLRKLGKLDLWAYHEQSPINATNEGRKCHK